MQTQVEKSQNIETTHKELQEKIAQLTLENEKLKKELKEEILINKNQAAFYKEMEHNYVSLKETESKLRKVLELTKSAVLFVDKTGVIREVNDKSLSVFRFQDKSQLIGKTFLDITAQADYDMSKQMFNQMWDTLEPISLEKQFRNGRGGTFTAWLSAGVIDEHFGISAAIVQDLTIQKELGKGLKRQVDLLQQLADFKKVVSDVSSIKDLTRIIGEYLIKNTKAINVWTTTRTDSIFVYNNFSNSKVLISDEVLSVDVAAQLLSSIAPMESDIIVVNPPHTIDFFSIAEDKPLTLQLILKYETGPVEAYYFGLNYVVELKELSNDVELLNSISDLIKNVIKGVKSYELLIENEVRFRGLIENQTDVVLVHDLNDVITYVSPSVKNYGLNPYDLLGASTMEFVHPEDSDMLEEAAGKVLERIGETIKLPEVRLILPNGTMVYTSITQTNLLYQKGIRGIVLNIRDVTERVLSEKQLTESEQRYKALTENQTDVIIIRALSGEYTYVSPSIQRYGVEPGQILGKTKADFIHPNDMPLVDKAMKEILSENGKSTTIPQIMITLGSIVKYAQIIVTNLLHLEGVEGIVVNLRDITDEVLANYSIKQSEEKFRNIFENSSDAIYITDLSGKYLEMNARGLSRSGYTKTQMLNLYIQDMVRFQDDNRVQEYLDNIYNHGHATTELSYYNTTKQEINIEINGKIIRYQGKDAIIHMSRDISVRKEMERKIMEASIHSEEKERSRFARDLHDGIGPYLSATKMFLNTLGKMKDLGEQKQLMQKAIASIDEIIANVKEISNNISPHVLQNFGIISAIKSFQKKMSVSDTAINLETNAEGKRFEKNLEISVFRIVIELINNTLKYARAKNIDITIFLNQNRLILDFKHNGLGFDYHEIIEQKKGQGLFNIINRVKALKGAYYFDTSSTSNFQFNATFKLTN